MSDSGNKPKPGRDHLIPNAAWHLRPKRTVTTTNWQDIESYVDHTSWSSDQWAWEFLRRNRFFQADCDALLPELEKKRRRPPKLDPRWLLHAFKCYDEPFSRADRNIFPPKWSVFSRVECWDTNERLRLKEPRKPWPIEDMVLRPGQIAIVLDLNSAEALPELMKLQWSSAWYKVAASADRLRKADEKRQGAAPESAGPRKPSLPHINKRLDYLRIADAFSEYYPAKLEEVCSILHRDGRLRTGTPKNTKNAEYSLPSAKNSLYKMIAASRSAIYEEGFQLLVAEAASKASGLDQLAPFWPRSMPNQGILDDAPWGKDLSERALEPPSPFFAGLGKRKRG